MEYVKTILIELRGMRNNMNNTFKEIKKINI